MEWEIDLLHGTAPFASRKAEAQPASSITDGYSGAGPLMGRVCGPNLRDASELLMTWGGTNRRPDSAHFIPARATAKMFSNFRAVASAFAARHVRNLNIGEMKKKYFVTAAREQILQPPLGPIGEPIVLFRPSLEQPTPAWRYWHPKILWR
ncbi:hypothetical protein V4R08_10860 [Nitrobacter sp. NHB1]|uniref:hypothetical protein n=1 Tax=Nitrobacter sp. NHB1 TaxID=3119830 RepID=UPI002FFE50F9